MITFSKIDFRANNLKLFYQHVLYDFVLLNLKQPAEEEDEEEDEEEHDER